MLFITGRCLYLSAKKIIKRWYLLYKKGKLKPHIILRGKKKKATNKTIVKINTEDLEKLTARKLITQNKETMDTERRMETEEAIET